jgi:hypothetical protein
MPDPTPPAAEGGSTTVQVDNKSATPPAYTPPAINMAEALPPEFRDKPYFKDKDFVGIIKEHANLQTLLGQRPTGIPKEDATDEEWGKFLGAIKPKSADEYALPDTDFSKAKGRSDEYVKSAKEILFNAGVPKRQAASIISGFESFLAKAGEGNEAKAKEAAVARETEFEGLLDKTYGTQKQAVLDRTKKLMSDSVAPEMRERVAAVLKDIPNEHLFALTAVLEGVHKKYIAEDNAPDTSGNAGGDSNSLQAEAESIMRSPAYSDFRNPGHDSAKQRVQELFGRIATMRK